MHLKRMLYSTTLAAMLLSGNTALAEMPRYVFFFLGDGMSATQTQAAEAYLTTFNGGRATEAADLLLLEGEILAPAVVEQGADRGPRIGPVHQHAACNAKARSHGNRVGRRPADSLHGAGDVARLADQTDVEGIAGDVGGGAGHHRASRQFRLTLMMDPRHRQENIGH